MNWLRRKNHLISLFHWALDGSTNNLNSRVYILDHNSHKAHNTSLISHTVNKQNPTWLHMIGGRHNFYVTGCHF